LVAKVLRGVRHILFVCFVYVIICLTYVVILVRCKLLSDSYMKKARPDKASRQPLELRRRAFIRGGLAPRDEAVNDRVQQIVDPDDIVASLQRREPAAPLDLNELHTKLIKLSTLVDVHQCNNLSSLFERKHNVSLSVVGAVDSAYFSSRYRAAPRPKYERKANIYISIIGQKVKFIAIIRAG